MIRFLISNLRPLIGHKGNTDRYHKCSRLHLPRLSEGRRPRVIRRLGDCRPAPHLQRFIYPTSRDLSTGPIRPALRRSHNCSYLPQFTRMERLHHYRWGGTLLDLSHLQ